MAEENVGGPDTEEKTPVAIPAGLAAVTAYGGALGAAHIATGKSLTKKSDKAEKAFTDAVSARETKKAEFDADPQHYGLADTYDRALQGHEIRGNGYYDNLKLQLDSAIGDLNSGQQIEARTKLNNSTVKALKRLPDSKERNWLITSLEEESKALKALPKDKIFSRLTESLKMEQIANAIEIAKVKSGTEPVDLEKFIGTHAATLNNAKFEAIETIGSLDKKVRKGLIEGRMGEYNAYKLSETTLAQAEKEYIPALNEAIGQEPKALEKVAQQLAATETLVEKKGVLSHLKRPFAMLKEATGERKLGIIAAAVGLGATTYIGMRALLAPKKSSGTFVEGLEQQKAAAAIAPSPAVG